jgi:hypothetical protein
MEPWQQEGTIGFFLPEPQEGWRTDKRRHDLATLRVDRFRIVMVKSEDQVLSFEVHGLLEEMPVVLQAPLPNGSEPLHVTILWRAGNMQLFLEGQPVAITRIPGGDETKRAMNN